MGGRHIDEAGLARQGFDNKSVLVDRHTADVLAGFDLAEINRNHHRSRHCFPIRLTFKNSGADRHYDSGKLFEFR